MSNDFKDFTFDFDDEIPIKGTCMECWHRKYYHSNISFVNDKGEMSYCHHVDTEINATDCTCKTRKRDIT